MKILNARLLKEFRMPGYCELCGFYFAKRQPHHLWRRTPELSIRINLIALGGILKLPDGRERFLCRCHRKIHDGVISAERVLAIVALRERCTAEEIEEVMQSMRRTIKPTCGQLEIALGELSVGAKVIALRELAEVPVRRIKQK